MDTESLAYLELRDIHAGYDELLILNGISLTARAGTITSVIGANGAGKSTLLKAIFGMVAIRDGTLLLNGNDITRTTSATRLKLGVAIVPQGRCNFPQMTVRENLEMGAYTRKDGNVFLDIEQMFGLFPVLRRKERLQAGDMSGGEQQMLEMAMALMIHPKVLLLDEPSLGLSPAMIDQVFASICSLAKTKGTAVIMVEQNAVQALKISNTGIVIELGKVGASGTGPEMLRNPEVRQVYLGLPNV